MADGLNSNPAATVRIIGDTDSSGTDAINNPLSLHESRGAHSRLPRSPLAVGPNRIPPTAASRQQPSPRGK